MCGIVLGFCLVHLIACHADYLCWSQSARYYQRISLIGCLVSSGMLTSGVDQCWDSSWCTCGAMTRFNKRITSVTKIAIFLRMKLKFRARDHVAQWCSLQKDANLEWKSIAAPNQQSTSERKIGEISLSGLMQIIHQNHVDFSELTIKHRFTIRVRINAIKDFV